MTVYISPNPGKAMAYGISQRAAQILLTHGAQVLMHDGLQAECMTMGVEYHNHIIQGMALPAVIPQHTDIEQHPVIQKIFTPGYGGELGFHFIDLTGSQKATPAQIDAEDGLSVFQ